MIQDPECGPIGVVYEATSAKGSPALIGFVSASRGLVSKETDVSMKQIITLYTKSHERKYKKIGNFLEFSFSFSWFDIICN